MRDSELEQALWDIIREVAANDPITDDAWGLPCCFYCGADAVNELIHKPTCTYLKAKVLAEKGILAW